MATGAPRLSNNSATAGSSESRWARTGDTGPAFKGLVRGARGRGRGRGGRGARPSRDSKSSPGDVAGEETANNTFTSKTASTPASISTSGIDKPFVPPNNASSNSKAPSRRASRTVPPTPLPQISRAAEVPSSPGASRQQNRKRRSQSGKATPAPPPKIHVSALDDNLLRSQRNRADSAPHTAPIKDIPPHFAGSAFDMRHNIDALVERVRAVAMADNRPSTPGSHIDWAGDEDDGLPDLDDWGIPPATGLGSKSELMSPIVVDGLKPLPGVEESSPSSAPAAEPKNSKICGPTEGVTLPTPVASAMSDVPGSSTSKQSSVSCVPSRGSPNPSSQSSAFQSSPLLKSHSAPSQTRKRASSKRKLAASKSSLSTTEKLSESVAEKEQGLAQSIHAPAPADGSSISTKTFGHSTSIHAPAVITELASAPANLSAQPSKPDQRTHIRAQTVGRPFRPEHLGRPSRSGHSTPRDDLTPGAVHTRTHSTPPAGTHRHNNSQRPVLTGDALSRLAKTIGGTALSPPKTAGTAAQED